jgi:hypothetical protein
MKHWIFSWLTMGGKLRKEKLKKTYPFHLHSLLDHEDATLIVKKKKRTIT